METTKAPDMPPESDEKGFRGAHPEFCNGKSRFLNKTDRVISKLCLFCNELMMVAAVMTFLIMMSGFISSVCASVVMAGFRAVQTAIVMMVIISTSGRTIMVVGSIRTVRVIASHSADKHCCAGNIVLKLRSYICSVLTFAASGHE